MPRVRSVISLGVGGQTQGAWTVPAKAMAYFGSTETRAYAISYGCSFFIESRFGARSIYCPPDLDNESGPRVPLQSLKLHAELAGLGARSLAGDILLHPGVRLHVLRLRLHRARAAAGCADGGEPLPPRVLRRAVPPDRPDPVHEVLSGAVPVRRHRRARPAGRDALRHGRLRRDVGAVRGASPHAGPGHRGRELPPSGRRSSPTSTTPWPGTR